MRAESHARVVGASALACVLLAAFGLTLALPTIVLAQREIDVPPAAYAARRAALIGQTGQVPIVVPGADLIRSGGVGRQNPNFWYLTGVESPYAILVLYPRGATMREALFLPDSFQFAGAQYPMPDARFRRAAWNRTIGRLAPGPGASDATGIEETYALDELAERLVDMVGPARTLYFLGDGSGRYAPPGLGEPRSRLEQLEVGIGRALPDVEIRDVTPLVERLRLVKDSHEIAALREAARISGVGMIEAMRTIAPGRNDLEIAGVMESVWKREGASRAAFSPIVASGASSVSLYTLRSEKYNSTDRVMRDGELIFIDYGAAEYDMYASDLCRTFPVSGRFSPAQRAYYEVVLEAQEAALSRIRPGVRMEEVIRAAAAVFKSHGYDRNEDIERMGPEHVWGLMPSPGYWIDGPGKLTDYSGARGTGVRDLGHHIGLEATDSRDYSMPLRPGMVFTIEPKLYVPDENIAIMIEDMILVTPSGYENLSAAVPRTVEAIEHMMSEGR